MNKFTKFLPLVKVKENADGTLYVYGLVTAEVPDKENEVCDYESTKPQYKAVVAEMKKATNVEGIEQSIMPLREMHTLSAVGAGREIDFDDNAKKIFIGFEVVDDDAVKKVKKGVYTGFSQGGDYVDKWKRDGMTFYTAKPAEVSLVDNPCLGIATYEYVKADGAKEVRKFASSVPAKKEPPTRKAVTEMIREAIESILEKRKVIKGMYEVGRLADVLQTLCYLRVAAEYEAEIEEDGSTVPDDLQADLESLIETFLAMAEEEAEELAAYNRAGNQGGMYMSAKLDDLLKATKHSLASHFSKAAAHHEKMAGHHAKVAEAHLAMHEAAEKSADGEMKKAASHHKAVASAHEHMSKAHEAMHEHCTKMAEAHTEEAGKTVEPTLQKTDPAPAAEPKGDETLKAEVADLKKTIEGLVAKLDKTPEPTTVRGTLVPRDGEQRESILKSATRIPVDDVATGLEA